jgi:subtilisin family serine protease
MNVFFVVALLVVVSPLAAFADGWLVRLSSPGPLKHLPKGASAILSAPMRAKLAATAQTVDQQRALDALGRTYGVAELSASMLDSLRQSSDVEFVLPNRRIALHQMLTRDSLSSEQYALQRVAAREAWPLSTGEGIVVGVLDTGIDWNHPDLINALWVNTAEDRNGNGTFDDWAATVSIGGVFGDLDGIDNDGNGYVDDVIGYDFVDQDDRNIGDDRQRDPIPLDEQGHGTSVSGVIAATANNTIGIAGLAFGAKVVTMRAFDATGNAEEDDIAAALLYAVASGCRVVNMSFGDGVDSPVLADAVRYASQAGVLLVASAGNTGQVSRQYPAGYSDVMAIGATTAADRRAPFSSTGSLVDLSAPGQDIITTAVGGRYRRVNGTSFAAPYVVAAAAMLWSKHPTWSAAEVRSTLAERSEDLGDQGWDAEFGNGRLNVAAALQAQGAAWLELQSPRNDVEIDLRRTTTLAVEGVVKATLFSSWTVMFGRESTNDWTTMAEGTSQARGRLAFIELSTWPAGEYTIRLICTLTNGRTLEQRSRVRLVSSALEHGSSELLPAWFDDRQVIVATAQFSRPTRMRLFVDDGDRQSIVEDVRRFSRTHSIVIRDVLPGKTYSVLFEGSTDAGDTVRILKSVTMDSLAASRNVTGTPRRLPFVGYVVNATTPVYSDGLPTVVLNDLSTGSFGPVRVWTSDNAGWKQRDSLMATWIPRATGDVNGDGRMEILVGVVGRAVLYTSTEQNSSPFASILWADTTSGDATATALEDIDGDGRPEIITLGRKGLSAITFRNGTFRELGTCPNPTPPADGSAQNRVDEVSVAVGDVNRNGAIDVAFSDTDGDLVIAEWSGGEFRVLQTFLGEGQGGSGYVASGDVDGDGSPDIVHAVPDATAANAQREYGRQVWTISLYSWFPDGGFRRRWTTHVAGVRYGIGYRNGIDVANVMPTGGNEVIVSLFARLYVFSWNATRAQPEAAWYRADAVTPRIVVLDTDNDNRPELVYGTTRDEFGFMSGMESVEFTTADTVPLPPSSLRLTPLGPTTFKADWAASLDADVYTISINDVLLARTSAREVVIDTARQGIPYTVTVTAENRRGATSRPLSATITLESQAEVRTVAPLSRSTEEFLKGAAFTVTFTNGIRPTGLVPSDWLLIAGNTEERASSVLPAGDSVLTVLFGPLVVAENESVTLVIPSVLAQEGMPTLSAERRISVTSEPAPVELTLRKLVVEDGGALSLTFSEPVAADQAERLEQYSLAPIGTFTSADVINDTTVRLRFDERSGVGARGVSYYVTVRDITSRAGRPMTRGAGNTLGFTLSAEDITDAYAYPQPVSLARHGHVTFANLPQGATITIYDGSFVELTTLTETDGNGGIQWNLTIPSGQIIPPGVYFYSVSGAGGKEMVKLVVKR